MLKEKSAKRTPLLRACSAPPPAHASKQKGHFRKGGRRAQMYPVNHVFTPMRNLHKCEAKTTKKRVKKNRNLQTGRAIPSVEALIDEETLSS